MSARKQRRVEGSTGPDLPPDRSDSDTETSDISKACSFQHKKSQNLSPTQSCTQSDMNLHRSQSDCDIARPSTNKVVRPKQTTPTSKHRITAYLGRQVPYRGGKLQLFPEKVGEQPTNKLNSPKLVVSCPCGDSWVNRYPEVRQGRLFRTNNKRYDSVIKAFESQLYSFQDLLHTGKFGIILLGYGKVRARHEVLKLMRLDLSKDIDPSRFINRSLDIHKRLHHGCVVELLGHTVVKGCLCTCMEFCEIGSLEQQLRFSPGNFIPEAVARRYFHDLISGLEYIHRQNIVHLNLCAKNLLISQRQRLKISDFQYADFYSPGEHYPGEANINLQAHLPPEVFSNFGIGLALRFNPRKADVWATGVVLFQAVSGKLPFRSEDPWPSLGVAERRGVRPAYVLTSVTFSPNLRDLLNGILNPNPDTRATIAYVKSHPFYRRTKTRAYISNFCYVNTVRKKAVGPEMEKRLNEHKI